MLATGTMPGMSDADALRDTRERIAECRVALAADFDPVMAFSLESLEKRERVLLDRLGDVRVTATAGGVTFGADLPGDDDGER